MLKKYTLTGLLSIVILCLLTLEISAQTVTGEVVDDQSNKTLPGANIIIKGTSIGTSTNSYGNFKLTVPSLDDTLVVSFIGFQTREIPIRGRERLTITLYPQELLGEELVVVGYGTQKRVNLTGSVSEITSKDIEGKPVVNTLEAIQGKMPGLIIQQNSSEPGSPMNLNIRGLGTIGNTSPLVLIDGVEGSLQNVNPVDIASISVLKDAASAAIYGSRAANGVILVTTKAGNSGETEVNYSFFSGFQKATRLPRYASAWEYATLRNEALVNSGMPAEYSPGEIQGFRDLDYKPWIYELYKDTAPQTDHDLSIAGGNEKTTYNLSLGYLDQSSMFKGPNFGLTRYNARLNLTSNVNSKLRVKGNAAYTRNNIIEHAYWTEWIIENATRMPTIYPIVDEDRNYVLASGSSANPLARLEAGGNRTYANDVLSGKINAEYQVTDNITVQGFLGARLDNNQTHEFRKSIDYSPYAGGGDNESSVSESFYRNLMLNKYLTLDYENTFGRHYMKGMFGWSNETSEWRNFSVRRINIPGNKFGVLNNGEETDENSTGGSGAEWVINSIFGRLNYSFDDRFLLEANFRYDGSSRFTGGSRYGLFPSFSGGWRLANEAFMEDIEAISDLKLRASWGKLGNQEIGLYQYMSTIQLNNFAYSFNDEPVNGSYFSVANQEISWETTRIWDVGVDLSLYEDQFAFTFDYYNKLTSDILLNLPVPGTFGGGAPIQNAGKVLNQGWEFSGTVNFNTGEISNQVTFNLSDNVNEVVDTQGEYWIYGFDVNTIVREGYPLNSYYALKTNGFYQDEEEVASGPSPSFATSVQPGDIRYIDRNGDGEITYEDDRFILSNPFPRYTYGFNYAAHFRNFDLNIFFQGVGKRSMWIRGEAVEAFHNNNEGPVMNSHIDRWTPANRDASYPRLTVGSESANNAAKSDFWIQDASYLRLKNVRLSYTIPVTLTQKIGVRGLQLYVTGQNLWTLSNMAEGFDPEVYSSTATSGRVYPVAKVYGFGFDIKF